VTRCLPCFTEPTAVGDLSGGRNWFWTTNEHINEANKLTGLRSYLRRFASTVQLYDRFVALAPEVASLKPFAAAIEAWRPKRNYANVILLNARQRLSETTPPSAPPPQNVPLEDWRESWYVNTADVDLVLPELDQLAIAAERAGEVAMRDVQLARQARGEKVIVTTPTKDMKPIDWDFSDDTVTPQDLAFGLGKTVSTAIIAAGAILGLLFFSKTGGAAS
jgi:hypothetical protein